MAIIGKTFNFQSVTAGDDGALYRILAGKMDILTSIAGGNPFTISNNVITIAQSYLLVYGRFMRIAGGTTISLGTIPTSHVQGRVIIRLDMTKNATESGLWQIETEVETIASGGSYRALVTNQDINSISGQNSSKYEAVLCTFTCASGTASSPVSALPTSLSYPLTIANGGTGATTKTTALANLGGMPLLSYTTSDTWNAEDPSLTHIENIYAFAGKNAIVECNYTGGNYKFIAIVDWGNANYGGLMILSQRSHTNIQTWRKGGSWYRTDLPDVMKITLHANSLAATSYTRLSITASEVVSGNSFCTATTGNTYITNLPTGIYRVTLQAMFPAADGATLLIGMNGASSSSQPNFTLPIQNQKGTSMVNRFNCSGILKKADGDGGNLGIFAYSSVALSGEVTAFVTIERLG